MKKLGLVVASILILVATITIVVSLGLVVDDKVTQRSTPTALANVPAAPGVTEGIYILPEDGPTLLIEELDSATDSISIEVYLLTDDSVIQALFRARDRGVNARVLIEEDPYGGSNQQDEVFATLEEGGIQVRWNKA